MKDKEIELKKDEWYRLCFKFQPDKNCSFTERRLWQGFQELLEENVSLIITDTHLTLISFNGRKLE